MSKGTPHLLAELTVADLVQCREHFEMSIPTTLRIFWIHELKVCLEIALNGLIEVIKSFVSFSLYCSVPSFQIEFWLEISEIDLN
jgi:hypothetical protein